MDDSLNVLYCIPVAVAVAQAAVDKGSSPGPGKGHKTVVGVPGIDHGIKFRAGCTDMKMLQLFLPISLQPGQLPVHRFTGMCVGLKDFCRLCGGQGSQKENQGFRLPGL